MTGCRASIRLFGSPNVTADGDPAYSFLSPRHSLHVLAYVILHRDAPIARDVMARTLWPDDDEAVVRGRLRRNLNVLLDAMPPTDVPWIVATSETLRWNATAPASIDVDTFDRAVVNEATYPLACDAYAGDLLAHLDDEWIVPLRERYRARHRELLETLIVRRSAEGDRTSALRYANALLVADPWREDVVRTVARLRGETGDRAGALRTLGEFSQQLHDELGVLPMPETDALRDAILGLGPRTSRRVSEPYVMTTATVPDVEVPFGGRDDELARLEEIWRGAVSGRGIAAFVTGEAGIGKSRLLVEFARRIENAGGRVLRGTTSPREARPYEAFASALTSALPYLAEAGLTPLLQSTLASLVPELATSDAPAAAELEPAAERARLFEAVARGTIALARTRPLAIVLEDLHGAGGATFDLLRYVLGRIGRQRVLLVISSREGSGAYESGLRALVRETSSLRQATIVPLRRLHREDVEAICARHADLAVAAAAAMLASRSDGHPLSLAELIRSMRDGALAPNAIPRSIAEAVADRLSRVGADAVVACACAAAIGPVFDVAVLGAVLGWDDGRTDEALSELLEARFIAATPGRAAFAYAFSHELVRDALLARIEPAQRLRLHRLIALDLERRPGAAPASERAEHWSSAGDAPRAARAYLEAARVAYDLFANDDAMRFASEALEHGAHVPEIAFAARLARFDAARRLGERATSNDDLAALATLAQASQNAASLERVARLRIEVASDAADAAAMRRAIDAAGEPIDANAVAVRHLDLARVAALEQAWHASAREADAALAGFDERGDACGRIDALIARANARAQYSDHASAERDADEAERAAVERDDMPRRIAVLASHLRIAWVGQDFVRARTLAERQLALGRAVGDRNAEAAALARLGTACMRLHAYAEALTCVQSAMRVFSAIGDVANFGTSENAYGAFLVTLGLAEEGRAILIPARERHEREGRTLLAYYAWSNAGRASAYLAEHDVAAVEHRRALALADELDSDQLRSFVLGDLGYALVELGDATAGVVHLERAVEIHRTLGQRLSLVNNLGRLAYAYAAGERHAPALAAARETLARYEADAGALEEPAEILWFVSRALYASGESDDARHAAALGRTALDARLVALAGGPHRASYAAIPWHAALIRATHTMACTWASSRRRSRSTGDARALRE